MIGPSGPRGLAMERRVLTGRTVPARRALLAALAAALVCALAAAYAALLTPGRVPARAAVRPPAPMQGRANIGLQAQAAISAALGRGDPAYRVRALGGGAFAARSGAGMRERFDRSGATIVAGATRVHMQARSLALGGAAVTLAGATPRASANGVSFAFGSLTQYYRNGPAGLEQGFQVRQPPRGAAGGGLRLTMNLSGNTRAAIAPGADAVTFRRAGSPALTYGALFATDAAGRALRTRVALARGDLVLVVDARGARYPLSIDPLVQVGQKITGLEEIGQGRFGWTVAMSEDGNTALVGGPADHEFAGAAWVFVRSGASWVQQGPKLTGKQPGGECKPVVEVTDPLTEGECGFGASVALSADGNTALIGSPRDHGFEGGAWVFERSPGSTWVRQAELVGGQDEGGENLFGKRVSLSADGKTALVGASSDLNGKGTAWVFTRPSTEAEFPSKGAELVPAAGEEHGEGYFGRGVALSADGSVALVGAPGNDGGDGAAWLFRRSGSAWSTEPQRLEAMDETGPARFGYSVALSQDATTALVGGFRDNGSAGAAWVFAGTGASLSQQGSKLLGAGEIGEGQFGRSVALSADGNTALVGAPLDDLASGAAWVFRRSPEGWKGEKAAADPGKARFGEGVSLSADGQTPIFGEPTNGRKAGAAWVGWTPPAVGALAPAGGPAAGGTEVAITGAGFAEASEVHFGAAGAAFEVRSSSSIVAYSPPGVAGSLVDVTVTGPYGTSEHTPVDRFAYFPDAGSGVPGPGSGGVLPFGGGSSDPRCKLGLLSRRLTVASRARVLVRLRRSGSARCTGKLTLKVRRGAPGRRARARTIGVTRFSIGVSKPVTVKVKLNAAGRALLRATHGKLRASLVVLRLAPGPPRAQSASVRLGQRKKV
jgi:IPT/TIG domain/FG-GAP repeat